MPEVDLFAEAVTGTYRSRALRTVLIIDDQFPTYADLLSRTEPPERFTEGERALRLYRLFRSLGMPCDVENSLKEPSEGPVEHVDIDHIRKSDLIVLDWQLTPGSTDSSKSLYIIRKLSETKHFNTIVLYTREPKLDRVWLDIACSLHGGWADAEELLRDHPDAAELWDALADDAGLPAPSDEVIAAYILRGARGLPPEGRVALETELTSRQVPRALSKSLIEVMIHRAVRERFKDDITIKKGPSRSVLGTCQPGRPLWLQSGNCFVTVIKKVETPPADMAATNDPDGIIDHLDRALVDWKPGLLQILISEIQNLLELEALATEEAHLRDPEMQTGLSYHLLGTLGEGLDPERPDELLQPIELIIDRLVEGLRRRIASDRHLTDLGVGLLSRELKELGWRRDVQKSATEQFADASRMARQEKAPAKERSIFRLNTFLSTEAFRRAHLTTGTIIKSAQTSDHWVCMSPACDMTMRKPNPHQAWALALHPLRPIVAVRLRKEDGIASALTEAEKGRHIFVETGSGPVAFCAVDKNTNQPVYEFLFPIDAGKVDRSDGTSMPKVKAYRLLPPEEGGTEVRFGAHDFFVVGQMPLIWEPRPTDDRAAPCPNRR